MLLLSTEVKSSYHMELEGLKRSLTKVEEAVVNLEPVLTTDGHVRLKNGFGTTNQN
jgi:hypothetical protein